MAKSKGLANLRESMTKRYGEGRIVRRENAIRLEVVPTGSIALDHAMRTGGWVRGRLSELLGQPGVSKSSLAISSMREAQKAYPDLAVGYVDMEHTWTFDWAEALGLDTSDDRLIYTKPRHTEDVSDQIREMMQSEQLSFIVVDSVGGMESAKAIYEKEATESTMGKNAQIISRMCKQIAVLADETNTGVLFVNQYRANFSGMGGDQGSGPKILKYATTMSVSLRRTGEPTIKRKIDGDEIEISRQFKAKVDRSKVSPAGRTAEYWFSNVPHPDYGNEVGVDTLDEAVVIGKKTGVIEGTTWLTLPNGERFQGKDKAKAYLRSNPDVVADIRAKSLAAVADEVTEERRTEFVDE